MNHLQKHYESLSTEQLRVERSEIQKKIEENNGRLTAHSSADLDDNLDTRDIIDRILAIRYSESI
ncbi:hypothetical protein KAW18_03940 [candidate division WOR-3 bacterium]|nr:hypothetical protein [candidate division WOR-3 bacterium]